MKFSKKRGGGSAALVRKQSEDARKRAKGLRGLLESTVMLRHVRGITEEHLIYYFKNYGDVTQVCVVEDREYALVTLQARDTDQDVVVAMRSNEVITINGIHGKVQVCRLISGLPKESESGSYKQSLYVKKKMRHRNYQQGLRRSCKPRLFISAVASAVASSGAVSKGYVRSPSTSKDALNWEVIAYDDRL
ncbi:hypothetical protein KP509_31G002300 [Ceratopteris richardii]|uniref:RRM domain-containing protein n=1 Tax=Ceratopteris richardii TaxID=49495 RepID=A0A8T2QWA9_CERRI|nr:hypothetical protein KP509_31G002300 [Ceratopteris richardii]